MANKQVCNTSYSKNENIMTTKLAACVSALDDLVQVYRDKFLSDVNLKTKTNIFPAHKLLLCARSPVFKMMFSNDMREANSDSIQVDDLEDDTVQRLLFFLYSDKLEDLQWETATKLYYAADKYQIKKLKLIILSFLIDNLSTYTMTDLLVLSDTHSDSDLLKVVEEFILDHEELIFCSNEWEKLMDANPHLALKTMHIKYKTKKKHLSESNCNQGMDSTSTLMVLPAKVDEFPKDCFICGNLYRNPEVYEKHLVHRHMVWVEHKGLKHNDGSNPSDAIKDYQRVDIPTEKEITELSLNYIPNFYCEMCDRNVFPYPEFYLHMMDHGAENCFRCEIKSCFKTFTSPSMFEQHMRKHLQDLVYHCEPCGVAFINQDAQLRHENTIIHGKRMLSLQPDIKLPQYQRLSTGSREKK